MGFSLPFFPMYAAETLADGRFQGWSLDERGAWITLLCYNWNDGDLPAAPSSLARLLSVEGGDMARLWSAIGDRFSPVPGKPDRIWCPRLEGERDKALQLSRIRARAGEKGANARWNKDNSEHGKRMRLPQQTHGKANAGAMRSECPLPSPSQSPKQIPHTAARLVSPFGSKDPHPLTTAVLDALFAQGLDAAPPSAAQAKRVEAAIAAATVPVAVERVAQGLKAGVQKPLTFHVDAIRGEKPKRATRGDLGVELDRWQDKLTPEEKAAWRLEAVALCGPEWDDAPVGMVGPNYELVALNEKFRAIAEARS